METIWLQRSTADIPWGFRLQGGRDYGVPLSVQRVTPGSVAEAGLRQGDHILKIGTISAANLSHMEGQELIKRAGNILQLTIRKSSPGPVSPQGSYGSQVTAQLHENSPLSPIPRHVQYVQQQSAVNCHSPPTHTTLPDGSTRIQIQRSGVPQSSGPPLPPTPKTNYDGGSPFNFSNDSGRGSLPDYTIPYKQSGDPYHEHNSPGSGLYGEEGYRSPPNAYNVGSSMSLPRGVGDNNRNQEPRSLQINFSSQPVFQASQPTKLNPTQAYESRIGSSRQPDPLEELSFYPGHRSQPSAFSPASSSQPLSPRTHSSQPSFSRTQVTSPYSSEPSNPAQNSYSSANTYSPPQQSAGYGRPQQNTTSPSSGYNSSQPSYQRGYSQEQSLQGYDDYSQERRHGQESQPRAYAAQYDSGVSSPTQSYQQHRPSYQQQPQQNTYGSQSAYQPDPYGYSSPPRAPVRPEAPPSYSQTFPRRQPSYERQGSGQNQGYGGGSDGYVSNTVFNQQAGVADFGYEEAAQAQRRGSQPQQPQSTFRAEPMRYEPQPGDGVFEHKPPYGRSPSWQAQQESYGSSSSPAVRSAQPDFSGRPSYSPQTSRDYGRQGPSGGGSDWGPAPPAPPPPPAPGGLSGSSAWALSRPRGQVVDEDGQRIPDELLSTVLKSKKGGGPKPFSYGVDLNELKKKIGPPTAPKTYKKKAGQGPSHDDELDSPTMNPNKPPVGLLQPDYRRKVDEGPRSQIDTSPINISMGTNPKKQSMSFKVLQWMTDTENAPDDPEPPARVRRATRDPTVHNAEDDEMRFTGLHPKTEIPSRSFKTLQKIPTEQNHAATGSHHDDSDDGLPETLNPEEMTDKRYKGGNIPSKVFKHLQKVVGDDTPATPPNEQNGDPAPVRSAKAPSQDKPSAVATDF